MIAKESITEIQEKIITDFNEIGDSFDQYAYLIELSCSFKPMTDEEKLPERLVDGCQSHVWLNIFKDSDGRFAFTTDSDTLIVKGVLYLLQELFCGQLPADVAAADVRFLKETAIMDTFESDRQKGLGYVIAQLQSAARNMAEE